MGRRALHAGAARPDRAAPDRPHEGRVPGHRQPRTAHAARPRCWARWGCSPAGAAGPLPAAALPLAEVARRNGERLGGSSTTSSTSPSSRATAWPCTCGRQPIGAAAARGARGQRGLRAARRRRAATEVERRRGAAEVRLDADRFLQVMANLLSNAIKHSPQGETVPCRWSGRRRRCASRCTTAARASTRSSGRACSRSSRRPTAPTAAPRAAPASACTSRACWSSAWAGASATRRPARRRHQCSSSSCRSPASRRRGRDPRCCTSTATSMPARRVARGSALCPRGGGGDPGAGRRARSAARSPSLVIATPAAQGSADAFCVALRRLAAGRPVCSTATRSTRPSRAHGRALAREVGLAAGDVVAAVRAALGPSGAAARGAAGESR